MTEPPGAEAHYAEAAAAYGAALERLARGYERDADKRRDLLQEIHVALWRSFRRFDRRCSLRTWVYRVAHNTAVSRVIRPQSTMPPLVDLDDVAETLQGGGDQERLIDRTRALERIYEAIHRLRPLDRQIMLLHLEQIEAAEIAEITGLSASNVATRVHRIKQLLIRQFYGGATNAK
jgi:RNA polymerase sigma-70 factor (ECF subfamily)